MAPVVGLLNHSGTVGKNLLETFAALNKSGEVKFVVFYRPGSTSPIPDGVEKRELDLEKGDVINLAKTVSDIEYFISAVGTEQIPLQLKLVDALATSKDLKSFFPSEFGLDWNQEDFQVESLKFLRDKEDVKDHAREKGVPITIIMSGAFAEFIEMPFNAFGVGVKANEIDVYKGALENVHHITSVPYIAQGVAQLILKSPTKLPNHTYSLLEFATTGSQYVEILTRLHGSETKINKWDEATYEHVVSLGMMPAVGARIRWRWGNNLGFPSEEVKVTGWKGPALEERWKAFLGKT